MWGQTQKGKDPFATLSGEQGANIKQDHIGESLKWITFEAGFKLFLNAKNRQEKY